MARRVRAVILRPYQAAQHDEILTAWRSGARYVLATAPTGAGKTVLFSVLLAEHVGAACVIAHRQELVAQISLSLAAVGVRHSIIGPHSVVKLICRLHQREFGQSFYDPAAKIAVAGVDTLIRRRADLSRWCDQVTLWVLDEAHHPLKDNKWGQAVAMFPNARGLGVTATPCRADGKGLGAHADGIFELLLEGPSMRELITQGYLSDYTIFCPPNDLDLTSVERSNATGDFKHKQLVTQVRRSHLTGDVVQHYLKHAKGRLGVTFATDVESAHNLAAEYIRAGVPTAAVSAKTPERDRHELIRRFRDGALRQLVNVDLFGEGFDLPALEVVSMARPTHSFPLYTQQFGRGLRLFEGKGRAIIIDHVGNVARHKGPPDKPRVWTLDRRESRRRGALDPDVIPLRVCVECTQPFEAVLRVCPNCSAAYTPARRDGPQFVDGDLIELDAATLAAMRGEIARIDEPAQNVADRANRAGAPGIVAASQAKQHRKRQEAQHSLRALIDMYAEAQRARGREDSEAYRRFWYRYGVDVMSAQALGRPEAETLACKILGDM